MVGGKIGSDYLDSTEVFDSSVGSWFVAEAKLPTPMCCLRATNIEDRILIFGRFRIRYQPHKIIMQVAGTVRQRFLVLKRRKVTSSWSMTSLETLSGRSGE